ncbi:hypothetical protein JXA47_10205 [Candidatus Sumerlaeota bacterium]|nr:hypothetical protein [Candidatus Sumerlaeota bacterium]
MATGCRLPGIGGLEFPLSRSRTLMFFVAMNFGFLGLDTLLAHWMDRTIKLYEWIPIIHGPIAGALVLIFLLRSHPTRFEVILYLMVLISALVVGALGTAFHWQRALLVREMEPVGFLQWLIFAPPAAGPMAFGGVALIGLMAALHEEPRGSGQMSLWGMVRLVAPISKTRQLLWLVGLGYVAAEASAILDHARSQYENPAVWLAIVPGAFATAVTLAMACKRSPNHSDHVIYIWTQLMMVLVGLLGLGMHLSADMTPTGELSAERLINFAPVFAPLLFTNMAILGLIAVLEPAARGKT